MPTLEGDRWANSDVWERVAWAARFRKAVAWARDELAEIVHEEVGKPVHEALTGDVMPLLMACRWHERHAARVLAERRVGGRPLLMMATGARVCRVALGRVGVIATWNYPVQLLGIQVLSALVAGNRVVVKPSERASRSQRRLLELAAGAGLPAGVLEWTDATREAGPALLRAGGLDHLVFTGSTAVGREIAALAGGMLLPTTLELSGCDSALVLEDADPTLAARSIWNGVVMNAGQTCMAPRRVLVTARVYERFVYALAPLAAGARPVMLIDDAAARKCADLAASAIEAGGRSVSGVIERSAGRRMTPVAVVDCPAWAALVRGEHFGPALAVVRVADEAAALAVHRGVAQHLSASVFTRDESRAKRLAVELGCTQVNINDCVMPTAHPGASIGGVGASGWGLSRGEEGLLAMTRPVFVTRTGKVGRAPTGTVSAKMLGQLSGLMGWWYGGRKQGEPAAKSGVPGIVEVATEEAGRGEVERSDAHSARAHS